MIEVRVVASAMFASLCIGAHGGAISRRTGAGDRGSKVGPCPSERDGDQRRS